MRAEAIEGINQAILEKPAEILLDAQSVHPNTIMSRFSSKRFQLGKICITRTAHVRAFTSYCTCRLQPIYAYL